MHFSLTGFSYLTVFSLKANLFAAFLLTIYFLFSSSAFAESPPESEWLTNYGKVTLTINQNRPGNETLTGAYHYKDQQARLYLKRDEQNGIAVYSGLWIQHISDMKCTTSLGGSHHWGRLKVIFMNKKFYALWNYCGHEITQQRNHLWEGILEKTNGSPLVSALTETRKEKIPFKTLCHALVSAQETDETKLAGQFPDLSLQLVTRETKVR